MTELFPRVYATIVGIIVFALAVSVVACSGAKADHPAAMRAMCDDRSTVVNSLAKTYKEAVRGIGIAKGADGGRALELYVSEGGSFTVVGTLPNGVACILLAGESWEFIEAPILGEGL